MDRETRQNMEQYDKKMAAKELAQARGNEGNDEETPADELLDLEKVKKSLRSAFLGYQYKTTVQDGNLIQYKEWRVENPYHCNVCGISTSHPSCPECGEDTEKQYSPICNEKALEDFFVPIEGIANINTAGSNLTDKQIEVIGRDVMYAIIGQIRENYVDYGIDSMADADQIIATIREVLMAALTKGRGGWMMEERQKSRVERFLNYGGDEGKRGWFR